MEEMTGLAASAAGGGLFGLIGTALGRLAGFFETRQEQHHERERWAHETTLIELQQAAQTAETEGELALAETAGHWAGLSASIEAEATIGASYKWVNAVRALTRPVLTLVLWLIAAGIWLGASEAARASITETATFAATAATLWWFGDRAPRREGLR
ncbi:hypothetical protein [Henriciella aquimarina]|uniref:hypothetical protein n=1 Tax=Henriciella aquimarina TaxID=545261 RepID=UPI000A05FBCB|nr:hypothetical protein [Henriciella aquimarina]